ncbi:alpha/beta fold hydrolase [Amycolatopsis anabasis]|uniref:alpha/beta fold hydrolase n=1 Tax=Amycolatopsis anabasis TaxID=1840409 RepID=UPI0015D123EE|nr:alpha/beta hydrolase [Amycolatopsis anabasis]
MTPRIPDFDYQRRTAGGLALNVAYGGAGPPVVLLHGFPETHLAWRSVAADLAADHFVVCPDLPGYGASDKPPDAGRYAKRALAADVFALLDGFSCERFALVGHDRGALVAFRAALDRPERISHLGVLDVIPALDMWASLAGIGGVFAFHLYLLAQAEPLPEALVGAAPDRFFGHFLDTWTKAPGAIPAAVRSAYLEAARDPASIHAICQDYRASAFADPEHDAADRASGRRLGMPALALWQDPGDLPLPFDPAEVWGAWASDLRTGTLPCGHFLPEECPTEVAAAIRELVRR